MHQQKNRILYIVAAGSPDETAPVLNELKRPLSKKGISDVLTLLEELKENPILMPDLILCSPTLYVHQTLDLLDEVLGKSDILYKDSLYDAPDYRILEMIHKLDDILFCVMIVGELPGLTEFISYISQSEPVYKLQPADGVVLLLDEGESWHTFGPQKARRRSLV